MTQTLGPQTATQFPDHTQLPETDGTPVKNFQEHPQTILLTDAITPVLDALHPDKQYAIGQDSGIYWRYDADEPLRGAVAPDWYYVPDVPPLLDGEFRRSYVMWKELVTPLIAIELSSADGSEERDTTPPSATEKPGKFWIYERILHIPYYGILVVEEGRGRLEMYSWRNLKYQPVAPDANSRFEIEPLGVTLGIWHGVYRNMEADWLRWWDLDGNLLPTSEERAKRAEEKNARLAERLRAMGVDPDDI